MSLERLLLLEGFRDGKRYELRWPRSWRRERKAAPIMKRIKCLISFLILMFLCLTLYGQEPIRIATYNIRYFSTAVQSQGNRLDKLKEVIDLLDADVIGLQEIDDRAALQLLFDPHEWHILIDDDSGENQDVALVVRKPLQVSGFPPDLDADDEHFLFSSELNEWFPDRRDLLSAEVQFSDNLSVFVMVHHAKSRFGGRADTDHRRAGASARIMGVIEQNFHDTPLILLGDFNDNCDDLSLNMLEAGDPNAPAGPEQISGPFLANLTEPLCSAGHVSHGLTTANISPIDGFIDTIDPDSRNRNNQARGTNLHTGKILFDQILIPGWMTESFVQDSATVFNHSVAVEGNKSNRASDHLPVFADFVFDLEDPGDDHAPQGIRIAGLLPNPEESDEGSERIILANLSDSDIDLSGWKLQDRAGNEYALTGLLTAREERVITMETFSMPLNNSGDSVSLIDNSNAIRDNVTYSKEQVEPGAIIRFNY